MGNRKRGVWEERAGIDSMSLASLREPVIDSIKPKQILNVLHFKAKVSFAIR